MIGTVGAITRRIQPAQASSQQGGSKQQDDISKAKGPTPALLDDDGRGADFVTLQWDDIPSAKTYELRFDWRGPSQLFRTSETTLKCTRLVPNRSYKVYLRFEVENGKSDWSPALEICTRPPRPTPPEKGYDSMTAASGITLLWDLRV